MDQKSQPSRPTYFTINRKLYIKVYTHGSVFFSGFPIALAASSVVFITPAAAGAGQQPGNDEHALNTYAMPVPPWLGQTSRNAELLAVVKALKVGDYRSKFIFFLLSIYF
jgi:hypothetical protein